MTKQQGEHRRAGPARPAGYVGRTTIRSLVKDLTQGTPTQAKYAQRAELARGRARLRPRQRAEPGGRAKARALLERLVAAGHSRAAA
ncbi:hypothetical protein AB0G64_37370 [Streptomyces longwoodensis]|uniref:hypothetical protein n=1 Tax=Streptomyces longwoodensis TaxID=68231 RepID=UPI003401BC34